MKLFWTGFQRVELGDSECLFICGIDAGKDKSHHCIFSPGYQRDFTLSRNLTGWHGEARWTGTESMVWVIYLYIMQIYNQFLTYSVRYDI